MAKLISVSRIFTCLAVVALPITVTQAQSPSPTPAASQILCISRKGTVRVAKSCKKGEQKVVVPTAVQGPKGDTGPQGPPGPKGEAVWK